MDNIINVTGGRGGNAFLLLGEEKSALVDCGMAYCAQNLIKNIEQVLGKRELDYILISHSHYDHIGAIPYLKQKWPQSKVLGAAYAKRILSRPNALKTIRKLSIEAATIFSSNGFITYDDELLKVDQVISDGECINLGNMHIKVLETLGHTQCSLSFLVNHEMLFASESTGYMSKTGKVYPSFIVSCRDAIASIHKCQKTNASFIISPHYGLVSNKSAADYWSDCLLAIQKTKEFVLNLSEQGYDEEQILLSYEQSFRDDYSRQEQPRHAFCLNAQNMIQTVLREEESFCLLTRSARGS